MKTIHAVRLLCFSTMFALLTSCGAMNQSMGPTVFTPLSRQVDGPLAAPSRQRARRTGTAEESWILPEAKNEKLLYVTNVQTVTIYSYPRGKHVGTLKGFYGPEAECVDATGDVFIGDGDAVLEYPHGGKNPIQTLTMPGDLAQGCAVDQTTGNLAVAWFKDVYHGYVAVYQGGTGMPTIYTHGSMVFAWCGYDTNGNLFADGLDSRNGDSFEFAELRHGSADFETITLNQSVGWPGAVQWDGKYLAVGDENANAIYRFSISGSGGTLQGTVNLGNVQTLLEFWIDRKKVVGADDYSNAAWYWNYPAGGSATKSITKGIVHPFGVTISK